MIPPVNTQRFKQRFRLADNLNLQVLGFLQKPPTSIYHTTAQPRGLEVALQTFDLTGKQIISVGMTQARYLVGSYLKNYNSLIYIAYEVNAELPLKRDSFRENPVTKMREQVASAEPEMIWVHVDFPSTNIVEDSNPTQIITVVSTVELRSKDQLGTLFIRDVHVENGLFIAKADYDAVRS